MMSTLAMSDKRHAMFETNMLPPRAPGEMLPALQRWRPDLTISRFRARNRARAGLAAVCCPKPAVRAMFFAAVRCWGIKEPTHADAARYVLSKALSAYSHPSTKLRGYSYVVRHSTVVPRR